MADEATTTAAATGDERREFRRVKAPLYCRPARRRLPRRKVVDVGLGGMRVYSDEAFDKGAKLEVELFLPDQTSVQTLTEVVWIRAIEGGSPAAYDVGLRFLDVPSDGRRKLQQALEDPA